MSFVPTEFLKTVPNKPGVYRMYDAQNKVIYVGKAKDLKKRVSSYFRKNLDSAKTQLVVNKIARMEFTITNNDNDALILENNLIKQFKPRYNILMRDDKSYPFIMLSNHKLFPRLTTYRGAKKLGQHYFGPFPSVVAVKETLHLLQKLFRLRSCTDSYFKHRTRPCLQYQIKRCSAPCVGYISSQDYQADLEKAVMFLSGKSNELIKLLEQQMQEAAVKLDYEQAVLLRDQIDKLHYIQQQQLVMRGSGDFDVIVIAQKLGQTAIGKLTIVDGKLLGSKQYFSKQKTSSETLLYAFITQHYLENEQLPKLLLVSHQPDDLDWLMSALSEVAEHKVEVVIPQRGERKRWLELALQNTEQALDAHIATTLSQQQRIEQLQAAVDLAKPFDRIECFDISHSQGEATVASCVVFGAEGAIKAEYRRFNIKDIEPGDDYAALRQAINRRYSRLIKEDRRLPELVVIDGGKGQLRQAVEVFAELAITDVKLISISKGPGRNPDYDVLWQVVKDKIVALPVDDLVLHTIQEVRDEAHRFAITGHKLQRGKKRQQSLLEDIEGIGAKRRRELLKHFGGLQGLQKASVVELTELPGISGKLAAKIYDFLH